MMDDTILSALRIAKANGGELDSLPEDGPIPRNPDEAARMLAEQRQKIYAASQEPLKAEMEGILRSPEWQEQQAEAINRQSFSPERMQRMAAEPQPIAAQREGLGLPSFNTPQQDNFEAQRAVEMARSITNEENRKDLKEALKSTWPVQMAEDVYMAARAPGDTLYGKLDPSSDLAIKRMFDLAGATAMQAPITMATKPDPSKIGIFGGTGARTADQSLLKQAQTAAERGMSEQDIWRDTGWWKAPDGQWRFEIHDQAMEITRSPRPGQEVPIGTVVKHEDLFRAYPQLNDLRIKFEDLGEGTTGGYYQPSEKGIGHIVINTNSPKDYQRSVVAHELQHAVQRIEGFAAGAQPSEFNWPAPMQNRLWEERTAIEQALRIQQMAKESGVEPKVAASVFGGALEPKALEYVGEAPERLQKVLGMVQDVQSLTKQNGFSGYERTMGEVEARNVQERLGDNPNSNYPEISRDINQVQRSLNHLEHPGMTQDIPAERQIYRSWDERVGAPSASVAPERQLSPIGLYSHGAETANALPQPRGTPQQFKAMLERAGVKPDELKDFDAAFAGQKQITREQAAEFFNERMPKVEETVLDFNPNFDEYWDKFLKDILSDDFWESFIYKEMDPGEGGKALRLKGEERQKAVQGKYLMLAQDYVEVNMPQVEGKSTKYSEYTLPGGENYREVLLHLSQEESYKKLKEQRRVLRQEQNELRQACRKLPEDSKERDSVWQRVEEIDKKINELDKKLDSGDYQRPQFQSSHWDEPNVLAHIRMADRTSPNGERILHVEEMQSDWAQKGRKDGFIVPYTENSPKEVKMLGKDRGIQKVEVPSNWPNEQLPEKDLGNGRKIIDMSVYQAVSPEVVARTLLDRQQKGVSASPYVTNTQGWTDLSLKRILKEAVDNGYESVVWTPGAEQAKRYDLSKSVKSVAYSPELNGGNLVALDKGGRQVINMDNVPKDKLADYIGKEAAEKLLKQQPTKVAQKPVYSLEGEELSVGGEGMRGYYDRIVPTQLQKLLKKIDPDAKLSRQEISVADKNKIDIEQKNIKTIQEQNENLRSMAEGEKDPVTQSNLLRQIRRNEIQIRSMQEKIKDLNRSTDMLSLQITPKIREAVKRGLPAFKDGGAVEPSHAQIAAGNYKKKHVRFSGMEIAIENEKGSTRSGTDKGGKRWSVQMPADYGYIKRTKGADSDQVDVYLGPHETSRKVFLVNQKDLRTGKFDEHKVMLGFNSLSEALSCYKSGFSDGKGAERASSVEQLSLNEFKQWLKHGDQRKIADDKALAKALSIASSIGPDAAQKAVNLASSKGA